MSRKTDIITDSTQFVYKPSHRIDDSLSLMLDNITGHIDESAKNYEFALSIVFTSALNAIDTTRLVESMAAKNIKTYNIMDWTYNFLSSRRY